MELEEIIAQLTVVIESSEFLVKIEEMEIETSLDLIDGDEDFAEYFLDTYADLLRVSTEHIRQWHNDKTSPDVFDSISELLNKSFEAQQDLIIIDKSLESEINSVRNLVSKSMKIIGRSDGTF